MPRLAGVNHKRAVAAFQRAGFFIVRESGHIVMSDGERTLVIPRQNPINPFTMGGIVADAGLTIEEFRAFL